MTKEIETLISILQDYSINKISENVFMFVRFVDADYVKPFNIEFVEGMAEVLIVDQDSQIFAYNEIVHPAEFDFIIEKSIERIKKHEQDRISTGS